MGKTSDIQWTDATWNPAVGCTKVDEDCKFCYMYRESLNGTRYDPMQIRRTKTVFNLPLKLKKPTKIFTASLTDIFHEAIDPFRAEIWDIIRKCPQHTFQILTKRPERILECLPLDWGQGWDNVWLGTSIGSQASIDRVKPLMWLKATKQLKTAFLSLEPLHGPIDLDVEFSLGAADCSAYPLEYIDWVIVGGESGNEKGKYRYRPCKIEWIDSIVKQCDDSAVHVFVKQLGTHLAKEMHLSDRHGGNIDEFPERLRIRQFPTDTI